MMILIFTVREITWFLICNSSFAVLFFLMYQITTFLSPKRLESTDIHTLITEEPSVTIHSVGKHTKPKYFPFKNWIDVSDVLLLSSDRSYLVEVESTLADEETELSYRNHIKSIEVPLEKKNQSIEFFRINKIWSEEKLHYLYSNFVVKLSIFLDVFFSVLMLSWFYWVVFKITRKYWMQPFVIKKVISTAEIETIRK